MRPAPRMPRSSRPGRLATTLVALVSVVVGVALAARPASADGLARARAEAAQIVAQIQAQGRHLAVLSEDYDQAQIRVGELDQQLTETQAQVAQTKAQVTTAQNQLRRQAVQDYTTGGSTSALDQLFAPGGERAAAVREYQEVASGSIADAIDRLDQSESELGAQESQLQSTQAQARTTLAAAQAARLGAQAVLADQQGTLSKLKGQIATLVAQQQAAEAAAQAAAFRARVAAAQRAAASGLVGIGLSDPPPAPGESAARAVAAAESQIGVAYVWGGATPGKAFDCSGLTMWAWGQAAVSLSHSAADQYDETVHVPLSDLQPGDLLFYDEGGTIGHVTMYVGPGRMIQAMETGTPVQITGIWTSGLVGAGRP